jgi:hypothetical protein
LCLLLVIAIILGMVVSWGIRPDPRALFSQYVLEPVPPSVAEIRVDQPKTIRGYGYVFRFGISKADLALILDSRPLERIPSMYVSSHGRCLGWDWSRRRDQTPTAGLVFCAYWDNRYAHKPPSWYSDLGRWVDFEAYALQYMKERPGKTPTSILEILIYNGTLGEAYFFTWSTHHGSSSSVSVDAGKEQGQAR